MCSMATQLHPRFGYTVAMRRICFGWITPTMGWPDTGTVPAVLLHQKTLLPVVARYFDSIWVFDHLYGFGEPGYPYLESWTTLTWLAARFPEMQLGTLVLGVGLRNPALL